MTISKLAYIKKVAYVDDIKLKRWFKRVFTMTLALPDDVEEFWGKVVMDEYETLRNIIQS
jgi:hypothetical protein